MTQPQPIRVGAVGLGWVTRHRHIPTLRASGQFDIVGAVDRRPGAAQAAAADFELRRWAPESELGRVSWLDEVEALTIGTAPASHFALASEALKLGKHVLLEKPFAMNVEEGKALVELARSQNRTLTIVHNFQFADSTRRLLADIALGRLGRIRSIVAWQLGNPRRRLPSWYEELPLGLFYDESPHLLYLLRRLAPSTPELLSCDVFASTSGLHTPAALHAWYRCRGADGASIPLRLSLGFESPISEWHVQVIGEEALGDIDVFRDIYVRLPNDGEHTTATVLRTSVAAFAQHFVQHLPNGIRHLTGRLRYGNDEVVRRFAQAVRSGKPAFDLGPDDAQAVLEMQHDILARAHRLGG